MLKCSVRTKLGDTDGPEVGSVFPLIQPLSCALAVMKDFVRVKSVLFVVSISAQL